MATLHILGSESLGNLYLLDSGTEVLIIEAGIRLSEVKKALNFDLRRVCGCIITHRHFDHSKYITDFAKAGIFCYTSKETITGLGIDHYRIYDVKENDLFKVGSFSIVGFVVPHGGVHCFGYLINHPDTGKIVFITDASHVPHKFVGLSHILCEANYADETMINDHGVGKHMSLTTALNFLKANDLSHVHSIVLLHLSATNSDAKKFVKSVQQIAPNCSVQVADKGMKIELSRHPF